MSLLFQILVYFFIHTLYLAARDASRTDGEQLYSEEEDDGFHFVFHMTSYLLLYLQDIIKSGTAAQQAVRMHPDIDCLMDRLVATCFRGLVTTCAFLRVYGLESFRVKKASSII